MTKPEAAGKNKFPVPGKILSFKIENAGSIEWK
jgi:hypothetical protein